MKVIHVITGLNVGGAEQMLYKLLSATDSSQFSSEVISMTDIGPVGKKIESLGIQVRALDMQRGIPSPFGLLKLIKWLRQAKPDVVQSWIYQADLITGIAAKLAGNIPLVWGIRSSNLDPAVNKIIVIAIAKLCAVLSAYLPAKILCCSHASLQLHKSFGYDAQKMLVVSNGFNVQQFRANFGARERLRKDLGVDLSTLLIGQAGRFDPQKDHGNFIKAAGMLAQQCESVHFVLCGANIDGDNLQLTEWVNAAGIRTKVHLLGLRNDMPELMAGLDIYSLSSCGESFPNVIGEAMACEVPCVVTNVGDSAFIVGDTGSVVDPSNPVALAEAWLAMINIGVEQRQKLGRRARQRVLERFSLAKIVAEYEALYRSLVKEDV